MEKKPKLPVSACLLGHPCRYDGGSKPHAAVQALAGRYDLVPVCPECAGGLPIPREPSERQGDRVFSRDGKDVTAEYLAGARRTLETVFATGSRVAVLKERSPSCGCGKIYDGTFTGTLVDGDGVTAELLKHNGIAVVGESELNRLEEMTDATV